MIRAQAIPTEIWVAAIPAAITAIATVTAVSLQNRRLHRDTTEQQAADMTVVGLKIDRLTEEQKKYNNLQERMVKVETAVTVLDERQKTANHRIKDLEDEEKAYGKRRKQ